MFTSYEGEPTVLIDAMITDGVLGTCRGGFQSVRGTRGLLADPEVTGGFRLLTYSPGGAASTAVADGTASFLPGSIHTICRLLEDGDIAPDVAVVNMSMPDDDGYCSFGTSTDFAAMAAYHAPPSSSPRPTPPCLGSGPKRGCMFQRSTGSLKSMSR